MWTSILIATVIVIAIFLYHQQKKSHLISEGKIINRKDVFYEKAEEFTLSVDSFDTVTQKIKGLNYQDMGVSMSGNGQEQNFHFIGATFEAQLWRTDASADGNVYRFQFKRWKENHNGAAYNTYEMNMLLTSIEKMFLSIDPNTKVRTWELETHSKPKFF